MSQSAPATASIDQLCVDTIRFLAVDAVEQANSGHPGAPMAQAPLAYRLFTRHMRHDPADPAWPDRDRFVLSCGHASALLYSVLHLAGYGLELDELKRFRQLGSKTPGHPENFLTAGVETTTGPLGQGLANAVGMAIAERYLGAQFNRDGFAIVDHHVWVLASDGDLMEGVASEASSLAGHLGLGKLIVFYDSNQISIDGSTDLAFTEDVAARYRAYGWHVLEVADGNDLDAIDAAATKAKAETARPTLVVLRTHIGYGSPNKQDTADAHGSPLGGDEVKLTKEAMGWPLEPTFHVPSGVREHFAAAAGVRGAEARAAWVGRFERYRAAHGELAALFESLGRGELPAGWDSDLPSWQAGSGSVATRKASGAVLSAIAPKLPQLLGGSADLAPSNNTFVKGRGVQSRDEPGGANFHFGVREHAMGAVLNGMALSGRLRPYGGTFLVFADYMRPAVRLAALMQVPSLFIFTHDSIFLGEDGPTHQPVGQLASLRAIPGLHVLRPADANETAAAWRVALEEGSAPSALVLTRQNLPVLAGTETKARDGVARGGYVLVDCDGTPDLLLLASGSEVALAVDAAAELASGGTQVRVVSMPCWSLFDAQDASYRDRVLPPAVRRRLAIEAGASLGWHRYVGLDGDVVGQDRFGASAPYQDLAHHFGFTTEAVVARARALFG